jgi:hypothetical protein
MAFVELSQGIVLFEPGDEVDQIYFPLSGMVSLVIVMQDGKAIETATVGREGRSRLACRQNKGDRAAPRIGLPDFGAPIAKSRGGKQAHHRPVHPV